MEYRYALAQEKPVIAFLHQSPDSLPKNLCESSEAGTKRLNAFRDLLKERMCKFWSTPQELGSVVSRSLIMLQRKHPGVGWVRGDLVPSQEASLEILDLRKQIEHLEGKLEEARTQAPPGTEHLAQGSEEVGLSWTFVTKVGNYERKRWSSETKMTWNEVFYALSPLMIQEASDSELRQGLERAVIEKARNELSTMLEKGKKYESFSVETDDFHTVKVQLLALGLIGKSSRNRSVKDKDSYWTLTPYGDGLMNKLRAIPAKRREDR